MNWGLFGIPRLGMRPVARKDFGAFSAATVSPSISSYDQMVANFFRSA